MLVPSRRKRIVLLGFLVLAVVAAAAGVYSFVVRGKAGRGAASGQDATASGAATDGRVALASNKTEASGKGGENGKEKAPVPVSVTAVATGPVSSYISSTANLVPENEVKVLAEAEGRVAELKVEEGNRVGRGQVLASLVRDDAEITFKKAQLKAANSRLAYERANKMLADSLMSHETFDRTAMENDIAQQELAESQWRLDKTTIRAPFGGRVTERNVKLGQHVRPGDALFTVSDFDPLIARIYLPEKDVFGLQEGREVRITLKASDQTRFRGRIRQISPVVDTATGTVKLTIEATTPPSEVRPGAFVTIDIIRETRPTAVLLPREAVIRELQDTYVFVARDGVAEKRAVSLGLEEAGVIEALSGVRPGDQVIVAGQGGLKEGTPIKVISSPEASDLAPPADGPARG
ncbi:MAG: efflux RND transporter periplasmic adaptor subunit [Acidobacteria bacterium]|nr:efflux RND transporter periplasmic adaptor subunit [Acidobacteriota bacterium]